MVLEIKKWLDCVCVCTCARMYTVAYKIKRKDIEAEFNVT